MFQINTQHPVRYPRATDTVEALMNAGYASQEGEVLEAERKTPPKIGKRFSSRPRRILKTWLTGHIHHPYPTVGEMELLQQQTGLTRLQVVTWFRNARRQSKAQAARPPTPSPRPIELNNRTTIHEAMLPFQDMNPLQRWQNSPPEHEPVAALTIAQAVSGHHGLIGVAAPLGDVASVGSWRGDSSASSAAASQLSNSSLGSAWSDDCRLSSGTALDHQRRPKKRRRRRHRASQSEQGMCNSLNPVCHPFQCTFCTETFRTKHNWQRHEKSMHLSLERWECSPKGPTFRNLAGEVTCCYCRQVNPNHDHLMGHNYAACHERHPEERVFYRKDHLQQHLKLMHEASFMKCLMDEWRHRMEDLRSRCGFCDMAMNTWADRVDHLADHFKQGKTMADWKGTWGFDSHVLEMVENSIPPYLIHYERNSPWPFTTQQGPVETPVSAFELIKLELDYWMNHIHVGEAVPTTQELQFESCCIILASETFSEQLDEPGSSWLRDLLMSSHDLVKKARIRPIKTSLKTRITLLKIHGKRNLFENCSAEAQLEKFVGESTAKGLIVQDAELQLEASRIVSSMESSSPKPSATFARFLNDLIFSSAQWLLPFRARLSLEWGGSMPDLASVFLNPELGTSARESAPTTGSFASDMNTDNISPYLQDDSNCYRRLTRELSHFVSSALSPHNPSGHVPSDEELQYQARWIMFDNDDPWNQTPADNPNWLQDFKRAVGLLPTS